MEDALLGAGAERRQVFGARERARERGEQTDAQLSASTRSR
jgi:hypothetical protein